MIEIANEIEALLAQDLSADQRRSIETFFKTIELAIDAETISENLLRNLTVDALKASFSFEPADPRGAMLREVCILGKFRTLHGRKQYQALKNKLATHQQTPLIGG